MLDSGCRLCQTKNIYHEFISGAIGGVAGLVIGHPLDTVKVLMQNAQCNVSVKDVTTAIRHAGGMGNFFRGLSAPAFSYVGVNAIAFGSYKTCIQRLDPQEKSTAACLVAGAFSGLMQLIPSVPVEIVKIHQQNTALCGVQAVCLTECVREILRERGLRGLYVGATLHALRDIPGFAVYFLAYSKLIQVNAAFGAPPFWSSFFAGALGGAASWVVSAPVVSPFWWFCMCFSRSWES
ncbi:unnamed protein product [Echinostoma caproni]|uniref:Mitochondrial carrier protein n=1 Tax=Echinostoma caproni TaxID=27848 RepID=A0A183AM56_9TREM|nr:unnamed protein product [Echinostoma caproni]